MKKIYLFFFLFLFACSFKPIHQFMQDDSYGNALATVKIASLKSEKSHLLKNYLLSELNPNHLELEKKYSLEVSTTSSIANLLVQQDSAVTRQEVRFNTSYQVKRLSDNKVIAKGSFPTGVSYAETDSQYSSYINKEYSLENGLKEIARQMRTRILIAISKDNVNESSSKRNK